MTAPVSAELHRGRKQSRDSGKASLASRGMWGRRTRFRRRRGYPQLLLLAVTHVEGLPCRSGRRVQNC